MKGTEIVLRDATEKITEADARVEKATEPLRKLQQDLMAAELAVNAAWSMFDALRSGVRTVARSAIAIAANATTAAGRIDNFIAAFATIGFSDQNTCITNTSDPYLKGRKSGSDPHVAATLQNGLTGCTCGNYTLNRPRNITITAVDDVVTLGEEGMLITGGSR
ncbi:putative Trypanosome variant surface glycoprotein (A type) [Trypanosoma vivax]|nr:putative Trypanosome variant surface glycoprotein (A type) [Trypanosoma vivax]